jgi:hypothetical protein
MMRFIHILALAAGVMQSLGCGGESGGAGDDGPGGSTPGGQVDTGLPEDTPLQNVTAQQYSNACEELRDEVRERLGPDVTTRGVCEVYGAAVVNDTAQCESSADSCVSAYAAGNMPIPMLSREQLDFTTFECGDVGELQGCSVTVGEFETCLEDQISTFETLMADNNCSDAAEIDLTRAIATYEALADMSPASCARVQSECPGVGPFATE